MKFNHEHSGGYTVDELVSKQSTMWDDLISADESFCSERIDSKLQLHSDYPYYFQFVTLLSVLDSGLNDAYSKDKMFIYNA